MYGGRSTADPIAARSREVLKEIDSEVQDLGARIVVLTPELERYTRGLHNQLNLPFGILTDLHLKITGQFLLVFTFPGFKTGLQSGSVAGED